MLLLIAQTVADPVSSLGPWVLGAGALFAVINGAIKFGDRLWSNKRADRGQSNGQQVISMPSACTYDPRILESKFKDVQSICAAMLNQSTALTTATGNLEATTRMSVELAKARHEELMRMLSRDKSL